MTNCSDGRKKFAVAVAAWLNDPNNSAPIPLMTDFGLCRSCMLMMYERFAELNLFYLADVRAVIEVTQDQIDRLPMLPPPPEPTKH